MTLDPYSSCPCGSGKKFKWCCQPIYTQIDQAIKQDEAGQHESALRIMDELTKSEPGNPEVWGRLAQLLYQNDRVEEAENALQKALEINPRYPFGYLLRGMFRYHEGEIPGALLLFRNAADYYDPRARDLLATVYKMIADCELKSNRPVAARAALRLAIACQPSDTQGREQFEALFGEKSHLPLSARREYVFRRPEPSAKVGERRAVWDRAMVGLEQAKLSDAARIFWELTRADAADASAWYNLAVAQAWQGENAAALDTLDRYVSLETDEARAAEAWSLAEVLRLGQGLEERSDHLEYSTTYQVRDTRYLSGMLQEWENANRLIVTQADQEQHVYSFLVLDTGPLIRAVTGLMEAAPLGAYILFMGGVLLRLWGPRAEAVARVRDELEEKAGAGLAERQSGIRNASLADILSEALIFTIGATDQAEATRRILAHAEQYFEETWLQRPLLSLNGVAPRDAALNAALRKKLRGVVQFLQESAVGGVLATYDFDRLRRKLGLLEGAPTPVPSAVGDITTMDAAALTALQVDSLTDEQLEQVFQAAQRLDVTDLSVRFARALTARPARPERGDRYPWYHYLMQQAQSEGNTDAALQYINEGEKADSEQNEGRRRNDYDLRRGQIHARRGEADAAHEVFQRLIQRDPDNLKSHGAAAEAMLSLRQAERALRFAEEGLVQARRQNNRDLEQHLLELAGAARKMTQSS